VKVSQGPVKVSVILATYEMPRHLEYVLAALGRQSFRDFEILLCDDGSGPVTRGAVKASLQNLSIPLTHLWQENRGFRKCRILNEAIRRSQGELLIFLDGDCVPHRDFVGDHWRTREPGTFGAGRRVEISKKIGDHLTVHDIRHGIFDRPSLRLLADHVFGETENWNRTIRWGTRPWLRKILKLDQVVDLKGCNFSVAREDMLAINGFDEAYEGYGREDTDVEIRMLHYGLRRRSLKGIALQFHIWHERRGFTSANEELLESARNSRRIRCERGIEGGDASGISVLQN
jgi:glycosyltransferase involved in cell wall biosynthesis